MSYNIPGIPSKKDLIHEFADFVEVICLKDGYVSMMHVQKQISILVKLNMMIKKKKLLKISLKVLLTTRSVIFHSGCKLPKRNTHLKSHHQETSLNLILL